MEHEASLLSRLLLNGALEQVLCRLLTHSTESRALLSAMTGKVVAIDAPPVIDRLFLCPMPGGIQLQSEYHGLPDLVITGTPLALTRLVIRGFRRRDLFSGELELTGETALAEQFARVFQLNQRQWRQTLRELFGPLLIDRLSDWTASLRSWGSEALLSLQQDLGEFLSEETFEVPTDSEMREFLGAVDRLRNDCDRLEARIDRLHRQLAGRAH